MICSMIYTLNTVPKQYVCFLKAIELSHRLNVFKSKCLKVLLVYSRTRAFGIGRAPLWAV